MRQLSEQEFRDWMRYAQIEPFGEERADLRAGIIASTIANVNRGKRRPFQPEDFMPSFGPGPQAGAGSEAPDDVEGQVRKVMEMFQ